MTAKGNRVAALARERAALIDSSLPMAPVCDRLQPQSGGILPFHLNGEGASPDCVGRVS